MQETLQEVQQWNTNKVVGRRPRVRRDQPSPKHLVLIGLTSGVVVVLVAFFNGWVTIAESSVQLQLNCATRGLVVTVTKSSTRREIASGRVKSDGSVTLEVGQRVSIPIRVFIPSSFRQPRVAERWLTLHMSNSQDPHRQWRSLIELDLADIETGNIEINCPNTPGRCIWEATTNRKQRIE